MPWSNARPRSAEYGAAHAKARKQWAAQHHDSDPCTRCGHPLGPMGPGLHLDHSADRSHYLGFAHGRHCSTCGVRCNVVAGAKAGRARQETTASARNLTGCPTCSRSLDPGRKFCSQRCAYIARRRAEPPVPPADGASDLSW